MLVDNPYNPREVLTITLLQVWKVENNESHASFYKSTQPKLGFKH